MLKTTGSSIILTFGTAGNKVISGGTNGGTNNSTDSGVSRFSGSKNQLSPKTSKFRTLDIRKNLASKTQQLIDYQFL